MKLPWFTRRGLFFVPASVVGWALLAAGLAYAVWAFRDIDSRSHSASDTLINFAFQGVLLGVVYSLVAFFTSAPEQAR